jgi:hypothetical protein
MADKHLDELGNYFNNILTDLLANSINDASINDILKKDFIHYAKLIHKQYYYLLQWFNIEPLSIFSIDDNFQIELNSEPHYEKLPNGKLFKELGNIGIPFSNR